MINLRRRFLSRAVVADPLEPSSGRVARYRVTGALAVAIVLSLGMVVAPSAVAQTHVAPQAMTSRQPSADTLSAKQQAIPMIAAFMATSDMPKLNAASEPRSRRRA